MLLGQALFAAHGSVDILSELTTVQFGDPAIDHRDQPHAKEIVLIQRVPHPARGAKERDFNDLLQRARAPMHRGLRDAERRIRRDVRALGIEPFATQEDLVVALRSGRCKVGLVSNVSADDLSVVPAFAYDAATVDAVGVGRHSRYPESAQLFVDWLIRERPVEVPESLTIPVSIAGYRDEEARLLAERAGYR